MVAVRRFQKSIPRYIKHIEATSLRRIVVRQKRELGSMKTAPQSISIRSTDRGVQRGSIIMVYVECMDQHVERLKIGYLYPYSEGPWTANKFHFHGRFRYGGTYGVAYGFFR